MAGRAPAEDPWHDMEAVLDASLRDLLAVRERYRSALAEVLRGTRDAGGPAPGGPAAGDEAQSAERRAAELVAAMGGGAASLWADLRVLQESLRAVEASPEKYSVAAVEVRRRKDVTDAFQQRLDRVRADVEDARRRAVRREVQLGGGGGGGDGGGGAAAGASLGQFMAQEYDEQRELRADQDVVLDRIGAGVLEAHHKAGLIGDELEAQDRELTELEGNVAAVQVRLEGAVKRVATLLEKSSDRGKIGIIVVLLVVLFVLIAFLFQ